MPIDGVLVQNTKNSTVEKNREKIGIITGPCCATFVDGFSTHWYCTYTTVHTNNELLKRRKEKEKEKRREKKRRGDKLPCSSSFYIYRVEVESQSKKKCRVSRRLPLTLRNNNQICPFLRTSQTQKRGSA
jgi:hypothetical protein